MVELSIIIPIYNVEEYLDKCLESVYKLNIKKEIILVNDESPDNSEAIIEKYKKKYPEETVVISQKNKGLSGARNSGLKIAKGKYVSFIDSDDFIDTKEYEKFFNCGKSQNRDIIIGTYKKYKKNDLYEIITRDIKLEKKEEMNGKKFLEKSFLYNCFKEEVCDDIFNKNFLIQNKLEFRQGLLHEDVLFTIQALLKAKNVKCYNIPFYNYRQRDGSIMSKLSLKNYQHHLYIVSEVLKIQDEENIQINGLNNYLICILWGIFKNQKKVNNEILKRILLKQQKYSIKNYIKIIIILLYSLKYEGIECPKNIT